MVANLVLTQCVSGATADAFTANENACCKRNELESLFVPRFSRKRGDIKSHSSVCPSVRLSVRPSLTKTLTWLISSEVLMIEH